MDGSDARAVTANTGGSEEERPQSEKGSGQGEFSERLMASRGAMRSAGWGGARGPGSTDLRSGSTHTPSGGWGVARTHARASYGELGAAIEASGTPPGQGESLFSDQD